MNISRLQLGIWLSLGVISVAEAGETQIVAEVSADHIQQEFALDNGDDVSAQTQQLRPLVALNYTSNRLVFSAQAEHIQQRFDNGTDTQSYNFTNANFTSTLTLVDRLLQLNLGANQGYNSFNPNNLQRNLFLSPDRELDKTQRVNLGFTSEIITGDYFGGAIVGQYNATRTERQNNDKLTSNTSGLSISLNNGDAIPDVTWRLAGSHNRSEGFNDNNFDTTFVSLDANYRVVGDFGLAVNASFDSNEISNDDSPESEIRDFSSYGIGFNYSPNPGRSISLTWNTSQSDDPEADDDSYVVGSINWDFSSRTQLNASASKRFFGRTSSANFVYNLKHLRAVIARDETVTSTSRLLDEGFVLTPFVCGAGASTINDCFLPDTTDYTLGVGETFINFPQQSFALVDSVIIRKSDSLALLYDKRKTTINLTYSETSQEFLQQERILESQIINARIGYRMGVFTTISLDYLMQDYQQVLLGDNSETDGKTTEYGLIISRDFGRQLSSELSFNRVDKEGNVTGFTSFTEDDYSENRITLSVTYEH